MNGRRAKYMFEPDRPLLPVSRRPLPGQNDSLLSFRQEDVTIKLFPATQLRPQDTRVELDDYTLRVYRDNDLLYSFDLCRAVEKGSLEVTYRQNRVELALEFTEGAQHPKPVQRKDRGKDCPCVEHPRLNPRGAEEDGDS